MLIFTIIHNHTNIKLQVNMIFPNGVSIFAIYTFFLKKIKVGGRNMLQFFQWTQEKKWN